MEDRGLLLLIREEGMAQKPSILMMLSAEEILRYWSLLSVEQRQAFLAERTQDLMVRCLRRLLLAICTYPLAEKPLMLIFDAHVE